MWTRRIADVRCWGLRKPLIMVAVLASVAPSGKRRMADLHRRRRLLPRTWLIATVVQLCLYFSDLYDSRTYADPRELFIRLVQGLVRRPSVWPSCISGYPPRDRLRRILIASGSHRHHRDELAVRGAFVRGRTSRASAPGRYRPAGHRFARELYERRVELSVDIIGFIDADAGNVGHPVTPGVIGTIDDIQ